MKRQSNAQVRWSNAEQRHRESVVLTLLNARAVAVGELLRAQQNGLDDLAENLLKLADTYTAAIDILAPARGVAGKSNQRAKCPTT